MTAEPMRFDAEGTLLERCGFAANCGRNPGHRGHHGGWRTGVAAVSDAPYDHAERADRSYRLGSELSPLDLTVLVEYAYHGSMTEAGACLGQSWHVIKNHLSACRVRTGAASTLEVMRLLGWLTVPAGLGDRHA